MLVKEYPIKKQEIIERKADPNLGERIKQNRIGGKVLIKEEAINKKLQTMKLYQEDANLKKVGKKTKKKVNEAIFKFVK